tara:strand:- start:1807 stop:2010 length:204 start_codon:yes stop_codon:yes gene_type:complete
MPVINAPDPMTTGPDNVGSAYRHQTTVFDAPVGVNGVRLCRVWAARENTDAETKHSDKPIKPHGLLL